MTPSTPPGRDDIEDDYYHRDDDEDDDDVVLWIDDSPPSSSSTSYSHRASRDGECDACDVVAIPTSDAMCGPRVVVL